MLRHLKTFDQLDDPYLKIVNQELHGIAALLLIAFGVSCSELFPIEPDPMELYKAMNPLFTYTDRKHFRDEQKAMVIPTFIHRMFLHHILMPLVIHAMALMSLILVRNGSFTNKNSPMMKSSTCGMLKSLGTNG